MRQLLQLLSDFGLGGYGAGAGAGGTGSTQMSSIFDIANITPGNIAQSMQQYFNLSPEAFDILPEHLFQGFNKQQLSPMLGKTSSPFMEQATSPLISSLVSTVTGQPGTTAAGGMAGSGQYDKFLGGARDIYGTEAGKIIAGLGTKRQEAISSTSDIIQQWRDTALELT